MSKVWDAILGCRGASVLGRGCSKNATKKKRDVGQHAAIDLDVKAMQLAAEAGDFDGALAEALRLSMVEARREENRKRPPEVSKESEAAMTEKAPEKVVVDLLEDEPEPKRKHAKVSMTAVQRLVLVQA